MAGRPRDVRAQTPTASQAAPSSPHAPSQAPEERDVDWENYNYQREPAADGGGQAENPSAAPLAGIHDFNTEELEAMLRDL